MIARLNVGGPAQEVALIDEGLRQRGVETLLVHGAVSGSEADAADAVRERGIATRFLPRLTREMHPVRDALVCMDLLRVFSRYAPDVVHTHTAKAGALGRLAALLFNAVRQPQRRCLVVHTYHGNVLDGYFSPFVSRVIRAVERLLGSVTDTIVTLSDLQREQIVRQHRIAPERKVVRIHPVIDVAPYLDLPATSPQARGRLGLPGDALVFGYAGRFAKIKDLPTLVGAFALAAGSLPNAVLLLVGGGEERPGIERLVGTLGMGRRILLPGWQQDMHAVHAAIDVAVMTSRNEGTPFFLIEAMAAGRSVVATRVGGIPDVVIDGQTGLLVPAGDLSACARALVALGESTTMRRDFGAAGRARARARFDGAEAVAELLAVYEKGLLRKRGVLG